jgi:hypothetical protein
LKKDLRAVAIYLGETDPQDGYFWVSSNVSPRVNNYDELKGVLERIPPNSLDMLIISSHAANGWLPRRNLRDPWVSAHCGARFRSDAQDRPENNFDERMPPAVARLIRAALRPDGLLVVGACFAGSNEEKVKQMARVVGRAVAGPKGWCKGVRDKLKQSSDGAYWSFGGYDNGPKQDGFSGGYTLVKP